MKKNLLLTGMMGVGKSTVGKKLAKKLKLKFIDIDKIIEKKEKRTIKEIFEDKLDEIALPRQPHQDTHQNLNQR